MNKTSGWAFATLGKLVIFIGKRLQPPEQTEEIEFMTKIQIDMKRVL